MANTPWKSERCLEWRIAVAAVAAEAVAAEVVEGSGNWRTEQVCLALPPAWRKNILGVPEWSSSVVILKLRHPASHHFPSFPKEITK